VRRRPPGFAEKGFATWGMQRGQYAVLTDPLDRLRQLDVRETFAAHGTGAWTVVYGSWRDGGDNIGLFSAWAPKRYRATALENDSWDLGVGDGMPGFMETYGGKRKRTVYLRYGQDRGGLEPLVIIQSHHGIKPRSLPQVSEEFRLFHNLWTDPIGRQLVKVENDGSEYVAAEIGDHEVKIRTSLLRQFQAARQLDLLLFIDSVRYVEGVDGSVNLSALREEAVSELDRFIFSADTYELKGKPFSRFLAKKVFSPPPRRKAGVWPYDQRSEEFPEFVIGEDETGEPLLFTCDPDALANYFGANPDAPHYLTPVFFRREVLQRYYEHPEKYSIVDGHLWCGGLWSLQIDNDHPDHVMVFLGDLGRDLPSSEWGYWRTFNIAPAGRMSETAFRRSLLGQFAEPKAPDLRFKWTYQRFREQWRGTVGWDLFRELEPADAHVLQRLRVPLSESQPEFEGQTLNLAKLLVDALNQEQLGLLLAETIPGEQSIARLERWLTQEGYANTNRDIELLRRVQRLRSKTAAHRKGTEYGRFLATEIGNGTQAELVGRLMVSGSQLLTDLADHFGVSLEAS
jgi:hypothetical protein